jgi:uncharacterized protein YyaL (SSP411 family)/aryl-alcohol dehydrogenase-like predicted oxidoreductase
MPSAAKPHENRLIHETSPYLLQHAHNPVDWYPWGDEALERAAALDRPILLSIGYAACHWCHVMERESFEDEAIAGLMNRHFVCIKVDREERPDLDAVYMNATVAMSGSGGWPMTVFLTPSKEPFFAGTYFPPESRYGRPGFRDLLRHIANLWETDRSGLHKQAKQLTETLAEQAAPELPASVGKEAIEAAVAQLDQSFDARFGGFGRAPKFPAPAAISLLLRHHVRTGDARALTMAKVTLDAMKDGGIYDHVGGGFARYATDDRWLVPHFEKMLYDNAELARVYLEAFTVTGDAEYERVARETLDYVIREMQDAEGGYYSATDADSEGEEGKFFVFRPSDLEGVLTGEESRRFCAYYDITEAGNWEGKSILHTPRPMAEVAASLGIGEDALRATIAACRPKVYEARQKRVPPLLDDKVLTAWNGLMIGAMAEGYRVLGDARYLASAEKARDFLLDRMRRPDDGLFRTARAGRVHVEAFLEDYAYLASALVDLYEAGGEPRDLEAAERLAARMVRDFREPRGGGFYQTAATGEALIVRNVEGHDGAMPSDVAMAAKALARLSFHLERPALRDTAVEAMRAHGARMKTMARAYCTALAVVDFLLEGPVEVVIVGRPGDEGRRALVAEIARHPLPNRVTVHVDPDARPPVETSLTEGRGLVAGKSAVYVCRSFTCELPATDPEALAEALRTERARGAEGRRADLGGGKLMGYATPIGTEERARLRAIAAGLGGYRLFGRTGLFASALGFGAYRVAVDVPEHREALLAALRAGVNLIDTSTNYADGASERLIGEALAELSRAGEVPREGVIVVSKGGYAQGRNLALARGRKESGAPLPEMLELSDDLWHSIHPEWIEDQLGRSLDRLGLERLDALLLHNPEYFFDAPYDGDLDAKRAEFDRRLQAAFAQLEAEVKRGRISFYGVSSNTSVEPADTPNGTSLSRMLEAAERAGGEAHHFRVLELPMNLLEPEALFVHNTGERGERTVLEEAAERGLAVLVNRPLNAIVGGSLIRLARPAEEPVIPDLERAEAAVVELEAEFRTAIAPKLSLGDDADPAQIFAWGERLDGITARLGSGSDWKQTERRLIRPDIAQKVRALDHVTSSSKDLTAAWERFRDRYLAAIDRLLTAITGHVTGLMAEEANAVEGVLDPSLPEDRRAASLSQKALWAVASVPAVTTVLVGMREVGYVEDATAMMEWPPLDEPAAVFASFAKMVAEVPGS